MGSTFQLQVLLGTLSPWNRQLSQNFQGYLRSLNPQNLRGYLKSQIYSEPFGLPPENPMDVLDPFPETPLTHIVTCLCISMLSP